MKNNDVIILFIFFQMLNIMILLGEDNHKFKEKKGRMFFIALPTLVILSLIWRPL
jgi:hypothetical protein